MSLPLDPWATWMTSDEQAIANLVYAYADHIDAGDFDSLAALFDRASVGAIDQDPPIHGSDAVRSLFSATTRLHADGTPRTAHIITNLAIQVASDATAATTASARSRYTVFMQTETLALQPIISGSYVDRFARDADGWHFTERRYGIRLVGDLSEHLHMDVGRH